jgi:hypothetical protein
MRRSLLSRLDACIAHARECKTLHARARTRPRLGSSAECYSRPSFSPPTGAWIGRRTTWRNAADRRRRRGRDGFQRTSRPAKLRDDDHERGDIPGRDEQGFLPRHRLFNRAAAHHATGAAQRSGRRRRRSGRFSGEMAVSRRAPNDEQARCRIASYSWSKSTGRNPPVFGGMLRGPSAAVSPQ